MKKHSLLPLVILAMLITMVMAIPTFAKERMVYSNKAQLRVFEEKDTDSDVYFTIAGGEAFYIDDQKSTDKWGAVPLAGKYDGYGYVVMKYVSNTMPPEFCHHQFGKKEITQQPTCTSGGMQMEVCKICGFAQAVDIPPLGHDWGSWKITKQPTCTAEGQQQRTCKRCGKTETQSVAKVPHTFGSWNVIKQPTCTAEGEQVHKCQVCGFEEKTAIQKLPHTFGDWKILREPTCTEEGEEERTCTVCGFTEKSAIEKLPHDFEEKIIVEATDHSAGTRCKVCKVCGFTTDEESFDPEGTLRRGDRNDEVKEMQQLLADQNYLNQEGVDGIFGGGSEQAVMKFQTDKGFTADGVAWPQTLKALQHDFGPWTIEAPATRNDDGERTRKCKECGFEQHETIKAEPVLESGRRGDDVRAVQQMLTSLGFDAGNADGIYGPKLDAAYGAFYDAEYQKAKQAELEYAMSVDAEDEEVAAEAETETEAAEAETETEAAETEAAQAEDAGEDDEIKEEEPKFEAGKILPSEIDLLVNAWIASVPEEDFKGVCTAESPVDLALTVKLAEGWNLDDEVIKCDWSVTNLGSQEATLAAILVAYGEDADFTSDNIVAVLDGEALAPENGNSESGTLTINTNLGSAPIKVAALAVSDEDGSVWLSNINSNDYAEIALAD